MAVAARQGYVAGPHGSGCATRICHWSNHPSGEGVSINILCGKAKWFVHVAVSPVKWPWAKATLQESFMVGVFNKGNAFGALSPRYAQSKGMEGSLPSSGRACQQGAAVFILFVTEGFNRKHNPFFLKFSQNRFLQGRIFCPCFL